MNTKCAKILIVEDEPQINRLIELVLLSDGFYNIKKSLIIYKLNFIKLNIYKNNVPQCFSPQIRLWL